MQHKKRGRVLGILTCKAFGSTATTTTILNVQANANNAAAADAGLPRHAKSTWACMYTLCQACHPVNALAIFIERSSIFISLQLQLFLRIYRSYSSASSSSSSPSSSDPLGILFSPNIICSFFFSR